MSVNIINEPLPQKIPFQIKFLALIRNPQKKIFVLAEWREDTCEEEKSNFTSIHLFLEEVSQSILSREMLLSIFPRCYPKGLQSCFFSSSSKPKDIHRFFFGRQDNFPEGYPLTQDNLVVSEFIHLLEIMESYFFGLPLLFGMH
jgi:hypothetical protein